jgi:hypothetical protein
MTGCEGAKVGAMDEYKEKKRKPTAPLVRQQQAKTKTVQRGQQKPLQQSEKHRTSEPLMSP